MSADVDILRMKRIDAFLADEAVVACLADMKWKCYDDFRSAVSNEQRIQAQARAVVLETFADELQRVRSRGQVEVELIAAAERQRKQSEK